MTESSVPSTPASQIDAREAGSHPSLLHGLRERRDHPSPGRRAFAISEHGGRETPTHDPGTATISAAVSLCVGQNHHPGPSQQDKDTSENDASLEGSARDPQTSAAPGGEPVSLPRGQSGSMIPYEHVTTAFAVDVSWSTHAGILDQEKKVVENLSHWLSAPAKDRARVLPWNHGAFTPIKTTATYELISSGATNPHVLNSDAGHHAVLRNCSLWFLLTDGEIDEALVKTFALGISEKGLHGKACVIILFGHRPFRPACCNISVGQAVFAVAPNCAFLFHDVKTEEVLILQCKGCFRALLPHEDVQVVLDSGTNWHELPRTTYDELAEIAVPQPRRLGKDVVLLDSGRMISLADLYGDRLSPAVAGEILDNDDDLKSVLLIAQSRGKSREIEDWVSKRRMSSKTTEYLDRPDVNGNASDLIKRLVAKLKVQSHHLDLETRTDRRNLRDAHLRNWTSFMGSVYSAETKVVQRNTVVDDALIRVSRNRETPGSPVAMSPVSSRNRSHTPASHTSYFPAAEPRLSYRQSPIFPPSQPRLAHAQLPSQIGATQQRFLVGNGPYQTAHLPAVQQRPDGRRNMNNSPLNPAVTPFSPFVPATFVQAPLHYPPSPFPGNLELSRLLYMKGYKLGPGATAAQPFCGRCALCEDDSSPLALLLKAKPADCETEGGFPPPNSHSKIKFPLALGSFSETDIISSFVCCEKCAYFLRRMGTSPVDDHITGAIPLVPLSNEMNRDSALKEVDAALEGRINVAILDQTFLSILYTTLDDATKENSPGGDIFLKALQWECRNFLTQISLPADLRNSFNADEETIFSPLSSTMASNLRTTDSSGPNSLITYPIDGFITLLKGSLDSDLISRTDDSIKKAIFQRFVFHLTEQQSMLREDIGADAATEELRRVLTGEIGGLVEGRFCPEVEALEDTYLLESDACESFRRLRDVFRCVEQSCGTAIRLFLQLMMDSPWKDEMAEKMFESIKTAYGDTLLFSAPWNLNETDCREMLGRLN
ncbi:MAG: hypothetical protein M1833_001810 [Piccolia ochrophora]|nr:MAG: hypothetical protein M1833_001810 [Piccolia ochrophora]